MGILETVSRRHITFDPSNPKHRAVYWQLRTTGKQDEELRFITEEGFSSVLTMMQCRIADHFSCPPTASVTSLDTRKKWK